MFEQGPPIVTQSDGSGEVAKILIHEDWYDWLHPVYQGLKVFGIAEIDKVPKAVEQFRELVQSLTVEFGAFGWAFSISLLSVLLWAAQNLLEVGKFVYESTGGKFVPQGGKFVPQGGKFVPTGGGYSVKELTDEE